MNKILLAILLMSASLPALAQSTPRGKPGLVCDQSAIYDASTTGSTQMVALQANKAIYVCGYVFFAGGTATNVKLVQGTGTNCGTGAQDLTPAYQLPINGGIADNSPYGNAIMTGQGRALCVNASGANAVQAFVRYAIQ